MVMLDSFVKNYQADRFFLIFFLCHYLKNLFIDPCESVTCKNGAQCQKFSAIHYACKCLEGFTGNFCEKINGLLRNKCFLKNKFNKIFIN